MLCYLRSTRWTSTILIPRPSQSNGGPTERYKSATGHLPPVADCCIPTSGLPQSQYCCWTETKTSILFCLATLFQLHGLYSIHHNVDNVCCLVWHMCTSHLHLGLPSGLFPLGFPTKTLYMPLPYPIRATCPGHLILLDFITSRIVGEKYKSWIRLRIYSLCTKAGYLSQRQFQIWLSAILYGNQIKGRVTICVTSASKWLNRGFFFYVLLAYI
jgi:hypothetical protein